MLKGKLKEALKKAGLNEELAETINITSESQIEGIVISLQSTQTADSEFNFAEILGSQQFADYVAENGFDGVMKLSKKLQSEHDKKVTAGIKTFQEKYFKKINGEDDEFNEDGTKKVTSSGDEPPAWAKALIAKVDGIESDKSQLSHEAKVKEALGKSKLSDTLKTKWASRIVADSETSIEDQVKDLETEYIELVGENQNFGKGIPNGTPPSEEVTVDDVAEIMG